jgi:hypothetical protein
MKSPRQIKKIVGGARARAGRAIDERILTDARDALANFSHNRPEAARPGPSIWKMIMESKVTRYSAAAVVTLAAVLVLLNPFGTSKNGGIVWAEVVNKVQQMNTVIHKEEFLFWKISQEQSYPKADALKLDVIKYASEEYGIVDDVFNEDGTLGYQVYLIKDIQQFMLVAHTEKKYGKISIPGVWLDRIKGILTPHGMVNYFTSGHYTELGRANFNNFDAEGFEITDPNIVFPFPKPLGLLFPVNDMVVRIWIDVETSLPVGAEAEFNTDRGLFTGLEKLHCEYRAYDFQWNAALPQGIFEPNIPDDYTEFKVTDFIPPEAKAGLVGLGIVPVVFVFWTRKKRKRATVNPG